MPNDPRGAHALYDSLTAHYWGDAAQEDGSDPILHPTLEPVGEREKLQLAKWLLLGIWILFALGALAQLAYGEHGGPVFETCKTILPPIATLIIGYYFSEKASGKV